MSGSLKKEYRLLDGVPVLALSVRPFADIALFRRLVITVPPGHLQSAAGLLSPHIPVNRITFVEGGSTRQESVLKALAALEADPPWGVLVHDGARPWVSRELVLSVMETVIAFGACVPIVEVPEAVKTARGGLVVEHPPRDTLFFAQTPQGFRYAGLLAAYRAALRQGVQCVDDAEIYAMFEGRVATVPGDIANRKITYERDFPGEREGA
jgi:2-C-methyl-D-erythritol 4-phosphate cytidylyltransferase